MRDDGLREIYVDDAAPRVLSRRRRTAVDAGARRVSGSAGVALEPGWRAEINLRAVEWIRDAARRLRRGFIILIDYGHDARELYSRDARRRHADDVHAAHVGRARSGRRRAGWLRHPGEQDITAHVDFTSVRAAAEARRVHDARLSRSDLLSDGPPRGSGAFVQFLPCAETRKRLPTPTLKTLHDAGRTRQHAQGADPRQRRRHAGAASAVRSDARDMTPAA